MVILTHVCSEKWHYVVEYWLQQHIQHALMSVISLCQSILKVDRKWGATENKIISLIFNIFYACVMTIVYFRLIYKWKFGYRNG